MLTDEQLANAAEVTAAVRTAYGSTLPAELGKIHTLDLAHWAKGEVETGTLDDRARSAFTEGQCFSLALALNLRTGYPLVRFGEAECIYDSDCFEFDESLGWCGCQVDHVAVLTPEGLYLDVTGPQTLEQLCEEFELDEGAADVMDLPCLDWISTSRDWRRPALDVALTFVDEVLHLNRTTAALAAA